MTLTFWPTFDEVAKFNTCKLLSGDIFASQTYDLFHGNTGIWLQCNIVLKLKFGQQKNGSAQLLADWEIFMF